MPIPIDPDGERTWLTIISEALYTAGRYFDELGDRLYNIPIIGLVPARACWNAAWWIREAGIQVNKWKPQYQYIRDFVNDLEVGTRLNSLIQRLWVEYGAIRANPVAWLSSKLSGMIKGYWDLVTDAAWWVHARLIEISPELESIIAGASTWFRGKASALFGVSADFWADPWGNITSKMLDILDARADSYKRRIQDVGEKILLRLMDG